MSTKKTLMEDLKTAIKEKNGDVKGLISILNSKLDAAVKESKLKGKEFVESDTVNLFSKELKQINESIDGAVKAGRQDLIDSYKKQAEYIKKFLPKQLSKEELVVEVTSIINKLKLDINNLQKKDMGTIMKEANAKLKGKADGKLISKIVSEFINKNK